MLTIIVHIFKKGSNPSTLSNPLVLVHCLIHLCDIFIFY